MGARSGRAENATTSRILDAAEHLVQVRGFNGFSYADVAAELQITKAALHYHFAGKADLGEALIARYARRDRKMCLCGMLAAEYQTLPPPMQDAVIGFFNDNERWLEAVLERGREDGSLRFAGTPRDAARMVVGGLEGAMLVARPYGDIAWFEAAAANLLAGLAPSVSESAAAPLGPAPAHPA